MSKIAEALSEEMKFKAGDVVCLTATLARFVADFKINNTKADHRAYRGSTLVLPATYSIIGRWADQCPAGVVQKHYTIRGEPQGIQDGKLPGNYHEHELCLLSDAVAAIEAVVYPPRMDNEV